MSENAAQSLALSLGVSALITVACRRMRVPALLPLLIVGLALGTSGANLVDASSLGSAALTGFVTVAIGLLIFEGALHLNAEELRRAPRAVWGLLTVGAVITWVGAACAAHYVLGLSIAISSLFGAALIVTGPTVVQPVLRLLRVTPRLHTALAAEAVLIDPIGVVATVATLEVLRHYVLSGLDLDAASTGVSRFVTPLIGGAGVGLFMGFLGYWLLRGMARSVRPEPQLLNLLAVGVCMTCVGLGELIAPEAGLAAVTICGVLMARARILGVTELRAFKELLAVILVGTLFVLLASRFDVAQLRTLTWREMAFVLVLIFVVRPVAVAAATWGSRLGWGERLFAGTFAPRGIVALSVVTVASAELAALATSAAPDAPNEALSLLAVESQRLELAMFVVIAGSVLLASTFSPLMAWALRIRAREGTSVLIIGAHPLGVAVAELLTKRGVETRLVDSNDARVAHATRVGLSAVVGDATDSRWMDDVAMPIGAGWVIAWTGNHDVDQLVARWAEDRLGPRHAGVWSSKPARGPLEPTDISGGDPITDWIDRLMEESAHLVESSDATALTRVLGWVQGGRFTLRLPGTELPSGDSKPMYIGFTAERTQRGPQVRAPASGTRAEPVRAPAP